MALLYPVGEEVVVVSRHADHDPFAGLGPAAFDLATKAFQFLGAQPDSAQARVFTTTPEIQSMLDHCNKYPAADSGYFYPMLVDKNGHYLRQIPLKEVDPSLVAAAANPAVLAVAAATQVIMARLDQLAAQIEDVGLDVKQILHFLRWEQESEIQTRLRNIDDIHARGTCSPHEWSTIASDRTALDAQHGRIVKELTSLADTVQSAGSLEEGWLRLRPEDLDRIPHLVTLGRLVLVGMARWSQIYLTVDPDVMSQQIADSERRRLEDAIGAFTKALGHFPTGDIGEFWSWGRVFGGGYPIAFGRWRDAIHRQQNALQNVQPLHRQLTRSPLRPLELNGSGRGPARELESPKAQPSYDSDFVTCLGPGYGQA